ncbi:C40 family peptidase [Streptomyces sp. NPDC057271]|uniref:C40 family peptidase n=1 Tax=unclassified Streptomyces TaxID=2593676 RepID=UPI00363A9EC7
MNHRLVLPSALSLGVLAMICGVTAPPLPSAPEATHRAEAAGPPAGQFATLGTGPAADPALTVGQSPADSFTARQVAELLDARARTVANARAAVDSHRPSLKPSPHRAQVGTQLRVRAEAKPAVKESAAGVAVRTALAQLGKPYVWGATGPRAFDCSGLTQYAYRRAGIRLPRVTWDQIQVGHRVPLSAVRAGDLVFYRAASHVALYAGGGRIVHAPRPGTPIRTADLHVMPVYAVVRPY